MSRGILPHIQLGEAASIHIFCPDAAMVGRELIVVTAECQLFQARKSIPCLSMEAVGFITYPLPVLESKSRIIALAATW